MPLKQAEPTERPRVPCAHETCSLTAICKVLTPTGWANFCKPHYVMYYDDLARENFTKLDLDMWQDETREEWRKRVFAYLKRHAKLKRFEDAELAA